MGSPAEEDYASFEERVGRTVYFDNLSPQVTESVLRTALDQYATVKNVKFIPNYTEPRNSPQCALVELDSLKKVKEIILVTAQHPFMMTGMPRPVRACPAEVEMFDDHPVKPGRKISCCWLDPRDPDFQIAKELKHITRRHASEAAFIHKYWLFCQSLFAKVCPAFAGMLEL
ncbi:RNA-binding family protein [Quillaja saponaria]|uniref:RNA-binding family protein n=1 Tax=Quillaja saponaria TaxID=32244 RepID=A0AAD7LQW9_QUISA|nr:RNA-binding family protein [Quillaja saponaria]